MLYVTFIDSSNPIFLYEGAHLEIKWYDYVVRGKVHFSKIYGYDGFLKTDLTLKSIEVLKNGLELVTDSEEILQNCNFIRNSNWSCFGPTELHVSFSFYVYMGDDNLCALIPRYEDAFKYNFEEGCFKVFWSPKDVSSFLNAVKGCKLRRSGDDVDTVYNGVKLKEEDAAPGTELSSSGWYPVIDDVKRCVPAKGSFASEIGSSIIKLTHWPDWTSIIPTGASGFFNEEYGGEIFMEWFEGYFPDWKYVFKFPVLNGFKPWRTLRGSDKYYYPDFEQGPLRWEESEV